MLVLRRSARGAIASAHRKAANAEAAAQNPSPSATPARKSVSLRKNALFYKTPNGAHVGDLFMSPTTTSANGR